MKKITTLTALMAVVVMSAFLVSCSSTWTNMKSLPLYDSAPNNEEAVSSVVLPISLTDPIEIAEPVGPIINSFIPSATSIVKTPNQNYTLSWKVTNATKLVLTTIDPFGNTSSQDVTANSANLYTISSNNEGLDLGTSKHTLTATNTTGMSDSKTVTVTVTGPVLSLVQQINAAIAQNNQPLQQQLGKTLLANNSIWLTGSQSISMLNHNNFYVDITIQPNAQIYVFDPTDKLQDYPNCKDSDNGIDYYFKGSLQGRFNDNTQITNNSDTCQSATQLLEYYCNGRMRQYAYYNCPNGCKDGACISAPAAPRCVDSDNGKNYYISGYTTQEGVTKYYDQCSTSTQLREVYCSDFAWGVSSETFFTCPNGCDNGACKTSSGTTTSTNSTTISISIEPQTSPMQIGTSRPLRANVIGTSNTAVTWSIAEWVAGGSINTRGEYKAPLIQGVYHVKATSVADPTKTAQIAVNVESNFYAGTDRAGGYMGYVSLTIPGNSAGVGAPIAPTDTKKIFYVKPMTGYSINSVKVTSAIVPSNCVVDSGVVASNGWKKYTASALKGNCYVEVLFK